MLGWGGAITDAQTTLSPVLRSPDEKTGNGGFNYGRYLNPRLDALIDAAAVEMNPGQAPAGRLGRAEGAQRPGPTTSPARQMIPWAMRSNVVVVHRPTTRPTWSRSASTDGPSTQGNRNRRATDGPRPRPPPQRFYAQSGGVTSVITPAPPA